MLVPTSEIIDQAVRASAGVGAFNVITLEHAEGVIAGAESVGKPVLLQISQNCVRFHGGRLMPIAAATAAVAAEASVPVALHLDHVEDDTLLRQAADAGFASVMYDASRLPYAENVAATRKAADWAHGQGLWIEAELGEVGGKDGAHAPGVRTDPGEAVKFVEATGVDALAVAVGSSHAMTTRTAALDHDLIARLRDAVPVPLVLHGSSGVPDEQLRDAVRHGMVKINIGTALNVAFTGRIQAADLSVSDPRKYLAPARDAIAHTVAHLLGVLAGS
ncbi:fructose-bisphosphate aldolase class II [Kibdelosporangium banguiense]|uniref:Fructose-bisphosphate aldolase class II n=1 Tax=Kibdelosporangium banguiense TaxID=1365924 RepID=A0ABS4TSY7_9PSEU|nr:class II fructose-bisphosphate aldolase [Kibdelosporangium banguiense]MBP2327508.1 fructose-bisphosphate aldolase class II [Kibdelosporangium banguiense]